MSGSVLLSQSLAHNWFLHEFSGAATLEGMDYSDILSHSSGGCKSSMSAGVSRVGSFLTALRKRVFCPSLLGFAKMAVFSSCFHSLPSVCVYPVPPLIKTPVILHSGPTLRTSFQLDCLCKNLVFR